MTQVNTCLKRVFTIFNIFFAIIGALIIGVALLCQLGRPAMSGHIGNASGAFIVLYIIGAVTMAIAILGAYGAHKESKVSLIIFLVCMVVGSLSMLKTGVPYAIIRPQIGSVLENILRTELPLDQASPQDQEVANTAQKGLHCCGLFSYTDWSGNIPDSCLCSAEEQEEQGLCKTVTYQSFGFGQSKTIYAEPCFPIILYYTQLVLDVALGVVFSLLVLALLGMILSSIIIHQMRYPSSPSLVMAVPPIFTTAPPKYQELHNPPSY